jgi:hypothetical protein
MTNVIRSIRTILIAAALAGALDILAAFTVSGASGVAPFRVLQAIASGILGAQAFHGGMQTAVLGLLLHFIIAAIAAAAYFAVSRKWSLLLERPLLCGPLYGLVVYAVMKTIVLPLSLVNFKASQWHSVVIMMVIHMLFVGLPIAMVIARRQRMGER